MKLDLYCYNSILANIKPKQTGPLYYEKDFHRNTKPCTNHQTTPLHFRLFRVVLASVTAARVPGSIPNGNFEFFYSFSLNILKHLYSHPIGGSYSIKNATGIDNNNTNHVNAIALYILLLQFVIL